MNENEQTNIASTETNNNFNANQQTNNFNMYNTQGAPKKKKSMIWIIPVLLLVVIVAVIAIGFLKYRKPEEFYKRIIYSYIDSLMQSNEENDYETYKVTADLDVDLEVEQELLDKEILDLINELEVQVGAQINKKDKKVVVELQSDYDKDELLDAQIFIDAENEETYLYAKEFLDKYLEVEVDDETYSQLIEIFEPEEKTIIGQYRTKEAAKIFKKEFANPVKSEYCSVEKATVKIDGKEVKANRNTIKMTLEQFANEFITAFDNIKQNEKLFKGIEEKDKKEIINIFEDGKQQMQEIINGLEDEEKKSIMQINVYTTGLKQTILKVEIIVMDKDEKEPVTIAFTKNNDEEYYFELSMEEEKLLTGNTKINDNSIELKIEIEELGSLEIDLNIKEEYNSKIDEIDEDKTASIENLSEQDQMTMLQNLQNSELYKLIEKFSNSFVTDNSMSDDYTIITEDDENSIIISGDDENNTLIIDDESEENNTEGTLQDNQVLTYDDKNLITFGIPKGYSTDRISENYQTLKKGDISTTITSKYDSNNEYYESIKKTRDYFLEIEDYTNVTVSDIQTLTINGKKFNHATLKYDYEMFDGSFTTYSTDYIWTKVSDNYVLDVQIKGFSNMAQADLEKLLTISVSSN